jgi:hypothetical protein
MTVLSLEQDILRLALQRSYALVHKDRRTMERLLADAFRYINASGILLTKADYLREYVESLEIRWTSQDMDESVVELYGDTAVLTCRVHDRGQMGTEPFDAYYRSLFVWARQQGEWRCVIGQTTATASPG